MPFERAELRDKSLSMVSIYAVRDSHAAAVTASMVESLYKHASSDTWCLPDTSTKYPKAGDARDASEVRQMFHVISYQ